MAPLDSTKLAIEWVHSHRVKPDTGTVTRQMKAVLKLSEGSRAESHCHISHTGHEVFNNGRYVTVL